MEVQQKNQNSVFYFSFFISSIHPYSYNILYVFHHIVDIGIVTGKIRKMPIQPYILSFDLYRLLFYHPSKPIYMVHHFTAAASTDGSKGEKFCVEKESKLWKLQTRREREKKCKVCVHLSFFPCCYRLPFSNLCDQIYRNIRGIKGWGIRCWVA